MRLVFLLLAGLGALGAPGVGVADELPAPPPGEHHLVVAPGTKIVLTSGEVITTVADPADPGFAGIYASAALARDDLNYRLRLERERDEAIALADAKPPPGVNLRLAGVSFGLGLGAGGAAAAAVMDGSTGARIAIGAGAVAVSGLLIWLFTR